ncbi:MULTISPECIES: Crp/Fnr family transcriptional regulator [unclassified Methylobacterium]|uniref:Crp/Fnr family transcriptional regulator n=1 Tax=unclassified Methylobacterium TaxID=2615210 RepID=UPI0011C1FC80|nr:MULTISPECIES: Crp/Fnr family transcriptional regulator [unclassified Methylobacterium]MCJ2096680.1 Crp/Fnr family transcriptional regulator [Methylobacterium sp. J-072]MCJ2118414.1 Crp/Fnr family transcriptional regulator [Methylobacterium sp. J-001]QEE41588.1 Crp/Fnr family transcriptional regulator [Methylobacterium sp. WL1]TXN57224.1 Crp/Fnr family transcriptional regulator [Methylobacterium sp. WL2]
MLSDRAAAALDKRCMLSQHELFTDAPQTVIERLAMRAQRLTFRCGQRIFRRGDESHGLLAVVSGHVRISTPCPEGRSELILNLIGPNEVFGEIALLDDGPRTADAIAATRCCLLLMERRDLLPLVNDFPMLAVRLLAILSGRLRRTSQQLSDHAFVCAEQRLAKTLLMLAGAPDRNGNRVLTTQRELGNMVGLSREGTNRHLSAWQRKGYITIAPGACTVFNRTALQKIAFSHT